MGIDRIIIIVFDGFGIGELPDASSYGDKGSHTLDNISRAAGKLDIPNLVSLGLGHIKGVNTIEKANAPLASFGRMKEASRGKDTATGHWEMAGVVLDRPFPTYPQGFPAEILDRFTAETGFGWLGGKPASGTGVIDEFGCEHLKTKKLIVYTSADSVFQIAAHDEVVPIQDLYDVCKKAREFLYEYNIGRVIARPFTGKPGNFERTPGRRDFSVEPPSETLLEKLVKNNIPVTGIGKIGDIFVHKGVTEEIHSDNDIDGIENTLKAMGKMKKGLIFTNLVDFDTLYGHRNDPHGYSKALSKIDGLLPVIMERLNSSDMLVITADHGCDPTTSSTDHSREFVPLLVYGKSLKNGVDLGTRQTFADLGQTIARCFGLAIPNGVSFLEEIL